MYLFETDKSDRTGHTTRDPENADSGVKEARDLDPSQTGQQRPARRCQAGRGKAGDLGPICIRRMARCWGQGAVAGSNQ
jgi:hypothetical protein